MSTFLITGRNTPDNLLDAPIGAPIASAPATVTEKKMPPARPSKPPTRPPPPKKTGAQAVPQGIATQQQIMGSSGSSDLLTGSPPLTASADSLLMVNAYT